jgi:hypothetical protein
MQINHFIFGDNFNFKFSFPPPPENEGGEVSFLNLIHSSIWTANTHIPACRCATKSNMKTLLYIDVTAVNPSAILCIWISDVQMHNVYVIFAYNLYLDQTHAYCLLPGVEFIYMCTLYITDIHVLVHITVIYWLQFI